MVRRKKSEVLKDLPALCTKLVYLEKNARANRIIKKMGRFNLDDILGEGAKASFEGISADRKELGLSKIKASINFIKTQLDSGREKIVVFAHHREVVEQLHDALRGYKAVKLYGGMSADEKNKAVEAFQEDGDCRVFVGSIIAAGIGLTLTAASYGCAVEWSYVPGENKQAVDRLHRMGQRNAVEFEFLAFENSLDENVIRAHIEKWANLKEILFD
jgi:SWI/SNF-related matrix-associated actin-dependent regulator 1 of chromatin subfamily A